MKAAVNVPATGFPFLVIVTGKGLPEMQFATDDISEAVNNVTRKFVRVNARIRVVITENDPRRRIVRVHDFVPSYRLKRIEKRPS